MGKEKVRCLLDDEICEVVWSGDLSSFLAKTPEYRVENVGSYIIDLVPASVETGNYGFYEQSELKTCERVVVHAFSNNPQPELVDGENQSMWHFERAIFCHDLVVVSLCGVLAVRVVELVQSPSQVKRLPHGMPWK